MNGRTDSHHRQPAACFAADRFSLGQGITRLARRIACVIRQWRHNITTRRHLAQMPEYLLKDVGLSRQQIQDELQKPFWRK